MKKTKKIAIIFAVVLLIGALAFAAVYYFTDLFKTPQQAFYSYLDKAAKIDNSSSYQEMLENLKAANTKSYKSDTTIGIELNSKSTGRKSIEEQQMYNLVNNISLNVKTEAKPSEKKSASDISIKFGGYNVANLEMVRDEDIYGIKSELIDDKYIAVENKNLKALISKLGGKSSNIPDKIESIDLYDLLYVSPEDEKKLDNTYNNIFKNNIPAENYTKTENVNKKINGVDTNTTAYTLSLSEKDFINVMTKLLETAKEDDTLLDLVVEKVNKIMDSSMINQIETSSSYSLSDTTKTKKSKITTKISKSMLKDRINGLLNELKSELNSTSSTKAEMVIYVANNDVAKIELKTGDEVQLAMDFYNKDDKQHVVLYASEDTYDSYSTSYKTMKKTSELKKMMEIEYKTTKNGDTKTSFVSFIVFEDEEEVGKISFDFTTNGKVGQSINETTGKITIEAEEGSIALKINSKVEYTEDVNVKSINSRNANILNNMSRSEIEEYFAGIAEEFEGTFSMLGLNNSSKIPNYNMNTKTEKTEINEEKKEQNEVEKKAEEVKEKLQKDTTKEMEELQKQMEELNNAMKKLEESNS